MTMKRRIGFTVRLVGTFLILLICILSLGLYFSVKWLETTYKGITMREIVFHMRMPLDGTSVELKKSFINMVVIPLFKPSIFLLVIHLVLIFIPLVLYDQISGRQWQVSKSALKLLKLMIISGSFMLILLSVDSLVLNFRFDDFLKGNFQRTDIYTREYIHPSKVKFTFPKRKRNLVFILLESIESTFFREADGGYYTEDLMPELRKIALENIHFSHTESLGGAAQVSGTGWTVGALVAHLLGIPLILPIHGNAHEGYDRFLAGAVGLTDILATAGYQQRFLIGSDKKFAGRDTLFKTHGNVLVKDLLYYKENGKIPKDYHVWWGFEDEKLYALAKKELLELSSHTDPFNLMLLTVDTHHVGGYVCRLCKNEFDTQYKNVIACASRQIASFVHWIQSQIWYENTTIVIMGDHLYMDGNFIPYGANRRVYNVFINSLAMPVRTRNRQFSSLDTFPSILDSLGVDYAGPGLALGRSLFKDTETLLEKYGIEYVNKEIVKNNKEYDSFLYDRTTMDFSLKKGLSFLGY